MSHTRPNAPKKSRNTGRIVRSVLKGAARHADPAPAEQLEAARRRLKRIGQVPKMADVPTELAAAHQAEIEARVRVDSLVILAHHRGMTLSAIAGLIGTTKQGALARLNRAVRRLPS